MRVGQGEAVYRVMERAQDSENGGWGEDDLEAMIVLVIAYVLKVGALVCLPVVDKHLEASLLSAMTSPVTLTGQRSVLTEQIHAGIDTIQAQKHHSL